MILIFGWKLFEYANQHYVQICKYAQDWVVGRQHFILFGFNDLIEINSTPACKFERLNSDSVLDGTGKVVD